jgi:hypothetical protein
MNTALKRRLQGFLLCRENYITPPPIRQPPAARWWRC